MYRKIQIEDDRIKQVKGVRDSTVEFIKQNGEKLAGLTLAQGAVEAGEKGIEIGSNASLFNAGAPLAEAAIAAALELERAAMQAERERLQTAKEMRLQEDNATVEVINGMANIQNMTVDIAQLGVEMNQDVIGILQAQVNVANAVNRAKRLHADRAKVLEHAKGSPSRDPSFRILQDRYALQAIRSRADAQSGLYLASRALEYELNQPFGDLASRAVFNAFNSAEAKRLENCLMDIASSGSRSQGAPQAYTTEISVRKLLGIDGDRTDNVTGELLTMGDQFRRELLRNENLDGHGGAGVSFASSLRPGNGLWPSTVCDDKIVSVEAQIVGDFSGDNEAQVQLSLEDGGVLRRCDRDEPVNWSTAGTAVIQAGVNTYGTAPPNGSLAGLSVASSRFRLLVPGADDAPANADIDLRKVEDVVLRVRHEARPAGGARAPVALDCLTAVGIVR